VDVLERAACSDSCPGLFENLKEVYLFGCDTLNPDPVRTATPEVIRGYVRSGSTKAEAERDELARGLDRFHELYDALEADRQLLFELRKGIPESRPEAEAQLTRLQSLALLSDPARLGDLVDRVEDAAPPFMDWRFSDFTTTEEATQAYIDSGANAFDSLMTEFRNEVLLSVANRLDGLLTVIDRAR